MQGSVLYFLLLFIFSCNSDFKPTQRISENVTDSKKNNTFICQYKIDSIKEISDSSTPAIKEVWMEKGRYTSLDSMGNEIDNINESAHNLVIGMSDSSLLKAQNFLKQWIVFDGSNAPQYSIKGYKRYDIFLSMVNGDIPDKIELRVYKMNKPFSINVDTIRIGTVWLSRNR